MLNGAPIFAVLTGLVNDSRNGKTGPMAQLWIERADMHPQEAIRTGLDSAMCGNCALRGYLDPATGAWVERQCYLEIGKAVAMVWKAWARGIYPPATLDDFDRPSRLGAYGDPVAVPFERVAAVAKLSPRWTGYTHQWKTMEPRERADWQSLLMASCDTPDEKYWAESQGWRVFRTKAPGDARLPGEKPCPAVPERSQVQCIGCPIACNGGTGPSLVLDVHGPGATHRAPEVTQ
jgi:hypothetical protein